MFKFLLVIIKKSKNAIMAVMINTLNNMPEFRVKILYY
jgi:hypothetical protein